MKSSVSRGRVTNGDLARMIAEGFAQTASKTELLAVEHRVSGVEGRLMKVENGLSKIEEDMSDVKGRLTHVEAKLDRALYSEYTHLEHRITRLEKKTGLVQ